MINLIDIKERNLLEALVLCLLSKLHQKQNLLLKETMTNKSIPIINQYVAVVKLDLFDDSLSFIEEIAQDLIADLDLTVIKKISHTFHPKGLTLAFILSESHLLFHTWPELGLIHVDLVTCSYRSRKKFENSLKAVFSEQKVKSIEIKSVNFE